MAGARNKKRTLYYITYIPRVYIYVYMHTLYGDAAVILYKIVRHFI